MALNKPQLEAALLAIMNAAGAGRTKEQVAADLAQAIHDYALTGEVVIPGGSSAGTYGVE
jgi:hypothetical protein